MKSGMFLRQTITLCLSSAVVMATLIGCTDSTMNSNSVSTEQADPLFQQKNIMDFDLTGTKKIVLTFDDGPSGRATPVLLDILRIYNIKATFFVLAKNAKQHPEIMRRMMDEGHTIANHSYSHDALNKNLYSTDMSALLYQVVDSDKIIRPYMLPSHPRYFRAPYGAWTASHAAKLNAISSVRDYIGPVYWNIGGDLMSTSGGRPTSAANIQTAADWACWTGNKAKGYSALSVETCLAGYLKETRRKNGGVILMHDLTLNTVEMVSKMIPILLKEGYSFTNLEDIRSLEKYQ